MKGAGSLGEPGRRKHATEGSARSEARPPSEPGAFREEVVEVVSFGSDPGLSGTHTIAAGKPI